MNYIFAALMLIASMSQSGKHVVFLRHEAQMKQYIIDHSRVMLTEDDVDQILAGVAYNFIYLNIPCSVQLAMMKAESNFDIKAKSQAGAVGVMQIMPRTALMVTKQFIPNDMQSYFASNITQPRINIILAGLYIRYLLSNFDWQWRHVFAAYNCGPYNYVNCEYYAVRIMDELRTIYEVYKIKC
jgi:hypothetical protein